MEVKHSKYFNYDAAEIVKGYLGKRRCYIVLLMAILLWVIFDDNISFGWRITIEIPAVWIIFALMIMAFRKLSAILFMDCDPYKLFDVLKRLEKHIKIGYTTNEILYIKAACCFYMKGHREEGVSYLDNIKYKKENFLRKTNRLVQLAKYSFVNNDRKNFEKIKREIESLPNIMSHSKPQKEEYDHCYKILKIYDLLWNEDETELRTLLNSLVQEYDMICNKVVFHMHLAKLDLKANEMENAKIHLDYVINYGNKMSIAEEAKELREKLVG